MRERKLGQTGIEVPELGLGTWGLSGEAYGTVVEGEARGIISRALAMGIRLFETATSYGLGTTETMLGEVLAGSTEAVVVTKVGTDRSASPAVKRFDADFLRDEIALSRKRIGDGPRLIALLHNPSLKTFESPTCTDVLKELTKDGTLSSWGVSAGREDIAERALDAGAPILSLTYNIFEVGVLRALRSRLEEEGTGVLAHSVLAYGLLTGKWAPAKEFRYGDHRSERWPDGALKKRIRQLDAVRPLVSGDVTTLRSAALRFALEPTVISNVVLGPRTPAQLDQLVREATAEPPYLSAAKLEALEKRLEHLDVVR